MATTLKFLPGSTIRWRATRFIVVDYADIDAIIAREPGKRKLERRRDAVQFLTLRRRSQIHPRLWPCIWNSRVNEDRNRQMIRAIAADVDGTLFDSYHGLTIYP